MEEVQNLLETIGVGRLAVGAGLVVSFWLAVKLWNSANKPANTKTTTFARCGCGWSGQASRHRPVCPRCGKEPLLV